MLRSSLRYTLIGSAIALSSIFSFSAHADVTGLWKGYATWSYDGSSVDCYMTIRFNETASELRREKGLLSCELVEMFSDPLRWQKNGTELELGGEKAGYLNEQGFQTHEQAGDNVKVVSTLNAVTGAYREVWSRINDGAVIYDVQAQLKR